MWLEQQGIDVTVIDITETPPSRALLAEAAAHFGNRAPLFNTSGLSYRALGSAVVKAMSDEEARRAPEASRDARGLSGCTDGSSGAHVYLRTHAHASKPLRTKGTYQPAGRSPCQNPLDAAPPFKGGARV